MQAAALPTLLFLFYFPFGYFSGRSALILIGLGILSFFLFSEQFSPIGVGLVQTCFMTWVWMALRLLFSFLGWFMTGWLFSFLLRIRVHSFSFLFLALLLLASNGFGYKRAFACTLQC